MGQTDADNATGGSSRLTSDEKRELAELRREKRRGVGNTSVFRYITEESRCGGSRAVR
jgi:hypothetical protein